MKRCGEVVVDSDPTWLADVRFFYFVLGGATTGLCVAYVLLVVVPEPVWSVCRWAVLSVVASSALYFIYTVGRWVWTRRSSG